MNNFRTIDRQSGFLLPPSVDEWLPEKHLARFVVEVIDGMDLRAMSGSYRGSGSASYHPRMLLGILVYGYATGIFSSRKLERATYLKALRSALLLVVRVCWLAVEPPSAVPIEKRIVTILEDPQVATVYAAPAERLLCKVLVQLPNICFKLARQIGRHELHNSTLNLPACIPLAGGPLLQWLLRQAVVEVIQYVRGIDPMLGCERNEFGCGSEARSPSSRDQPLRASVKPSHPLMYGWPVFDKVQLP